LRLALVTGVDVVAVLLGLVAAVEVVMVVAGSKVGSKVEAGPGHGGGCGGVGLVVVPEVGMMSVK
jgi:hypothetical protein